MIGGRNAKRAASDITARLPEFQAKRTTVLSCQKAIVDAHEGFCTVNVQAYSTRIAFA
ncbi:MAG: hypothetical protein K0Q73_2551 [Paenibacillus sp.]|jgi:hypothetical protein|nr:hypothetical protein [Paenibacillus sp.]